MRPAPALAAVVLAVLASAPAAGQAPPPDRWVITFAPHGLIYPLATADPRRVTSSVGLIAVDTTIADSGWRWWQLRLGGRFRLLRLHRAGEAESGFQLDFDGGFLGFFDIDRKLDNVGWDGFYGLLLSWRASPSFAVHAGAQHDSAHSGDEYMVRTGRPRFGYTREEVVLGVAWTPDPRWLVYSDLGWSFNDRADLGQRAARLQAGAEHRWPTRLLGREAVWYAALDVAATEERGWRPTATLQVGVELPTGWGSGRYRLALEALHGRTPLGDFYREDQTHLGLGLWYDL